MSLDFKTTLKLLLPTLCIFYTLRWGGLRPSEAHLETFGNDDLYVELRFPAHPKGPLADGKVTFEGTLTTANSEIPVKGSRVVGAKGTQYHFQSKLGRFSGTLKGQAKRCEPAMHFEWAERPSVPISRRGVLKAGFCY